MILLRAVTCALLAISLLIAGCSSDSTFIPLPGTVSAPSFTPPPGTFAAAQSVTLATATADASIRYTVDNTNPTETTGTIYTGAILVAATTTIKAIAYKSGMTSSSVVTGTYTITPPVSRDAWAPTSTTKAPTSRKEHKAFWTGSMMIIWGGNATGGALYDPAHDTWTAMDTTNAPDRTDGSAVWTGTRMIVWGGFASPGFGTNVGASYDPGSNTWTPISTTGVTGRYRHAAAWTGSEMIVWGGVSGGNYYTNSGSAYNPATDSWRDLPTGNAPSGRVDAVAVATLGSTVSGTLPQGSEIKMIVWGGYDGTVHLGSGAVYDVNSNTWSTMSNNGAPSARSNHTAIWSGTQVIIWGGGDLSITTFNDGARYNPVTNTWNTLTITGAPVKRCYHTAVWTGSKMIIWGGENADDWVLNSGGAYDPSMNEWTTTTTTGAPSRRSLHTAVWTGTEMIVWGGNQGGDTGGRYTP